MPNLCVRLFRVKVLVATVILAAWLASITTSAAAQRENEHEVLAAATKINTSVEGVHAFPVLPAGFSPLTATNRELLTYGLPQRPDATANPSEYKHWVRAMSALQACYQSVVEAQRSTTATSQSCHATDVKELPYSSRAMMPSGLPDRPNIDGTTARKSSNWSGIALTNKLTIWNTKTSFNKVEALWNVPVPNHPFGSAPCSDGPWWALTWNGIDGFTDTDVVQGGSSSYFDGGGCGGTIETYGWIEWAPSYNVLETMCSGKPCTVNPGDDFWVITYAAPGTTEQFVFVEDLTQPWSGTFGLTYKSGAGVAGSSAEFIVERPCCSGNNPVPLGNYVDEFFENSFAYDVAGTQFYPGSTAASTYIITMQADDGVTDISEPYSYGATGSQGKYSIWMEDENCAFSGGCMP